MADNTVLNAGSGGDTIATDDIAGVKYQRVKLSLGADGAASDAPIGNGTAAAAMRVTLASDSTGLVSLAAGTNTNEVVGDVAHDAVSAGNPVLTGGYASAAAPTDVSADGDAVRLWALRSGAQAIQPTFAGVLGVAGNGASGTGVQRVTLANDSTGVIATVGAVTAITNALPAGTNAIGKLAANSGVDIGDIDVLSIVPGVGATNLGKAEDAVHADGDTGVMALAVRRDANTTLVSATGDYSPLQVDASGSLKVAIISGAGSGGTAMTDAAAFTRATTSVTPIAAVVETSAPTLTNGNVGGLSLTTAGALRVNVASGGVAAAVEDAAAAGGEEGVMMLAVRRDSASSGVSADGDFAALSVTSDGSLRVSGGGGGTQYAEDAVHTSGDTGTMLLAVRNDAGTTLVSATGDYSPLSVESNGRLVVSVAGSVGMLADDSAFTVGTNSAVASGFLADETATDSVDEGDIGIGRMTLDRKQIFTQYAHTAGGVSLNSLIAPATPAKNVITAAASQIYSITAFNLLATPVYLKIWDNVTGSVTLGTTACNYQFMIPGSTAGAGFTVPFTPGIVFANGIITAVTSAISTTDNTSTTANSVIVNVCYK